METVHANHRCVNRGVLDFNLKGLGSNLAPTHSFKLDSSSIGALLEIAVRLLARDMQLFSRMDKSCPCPADRQLFGLN
jgi:hypothetical protein